MAKNKKIAQAVVETAAAVGEAVVASAATPDAVEAAPVPLQQIRIKSPGVVPLVKKEKFEIEYLKQVVALGGMLYNSAKAALADGKINMFDTMHLLPVLPAIAPVVANVSLAIPELSDLSVTEKDILANHLKAVCPDAAGDLDANTKIAACLEFAAAAKKMYSVFALRKTV